MKIKKETPICPECGSREIRSRLRTKDFWCRRCAYLGKREDFFRDTFDVVNKKREEIKK